MLYADHAIGFVFPVYYGSLPGIVREFFSKASFKADYIFAVATCGSGAGTVLADLQDITQDYDYHFDYMNSLVMVDNFLPVFAIEDEIRKLPEKKTEEMLAQIIADIESRKESIPTVSAEAKAMAAMAKTFLQEKVKAYSSQGFMINQKCTLCGICASVCPAANVSVTDKVEFSDKCESCYACIHACPQNAIHLEKEKSVKRFRHPDVSLDEIIAANKV